MHLTEQLPEPLRGRDLNTWQYDTVTARLPAIAQRVCDENILTHEQAEAVLALAFDMPNGFIRSFKGSDAPDEGDWSVYIQPHMGESWLDAPWFFVEMYFFRRILEATGYFVPGEGYGLDPYRLQKLSGIATADAGLGRMIDIASGHGARTVLREILVQDLWGNQADLSIWPLDADNNANGPDGGHLLVDDTDEVASLLAQKPPSQAIIALVADNAGLEFLGDLLTIDFLLQNRLAGEVFLFLKPYPTFVSDATAPDLTSSLVYLSNHDDHKIRVVGIRLLDYLREGRLKPRSHLFWTSPKPFWEMPLDLRRQLNHSDLVILKGDMNYRRLVGDLHWPYTTPISALPKAINKPILALRVCKAEVAVGLSPESLDKANHVDPAWRVNGRWGMAQLIEPRFDV